MNNDDALKKVLGHAARTMLLDIDALQSAIADVEEKLFPDGGVDARLQQADVEMAKQLLVYTRMYRDLIVCVTRSYRHWLLDAGGSVRDNGKL